MLTTSKSINGFDPRTIPGCALWLDASQDTTSVGSYVTTLPDRSGKLNHLTATSSNVITISKSGPTGQQVYNFSNCRATHSNFKWELDFTQIVVVKGTGYWNVSMGYVNSIYAANDSLLYVGQATSFYDSDTVIPHANIFSFTPQGLTGWQMFCIGYTTNSTTATNYSLNGVERTTAVSSGISLVQSSNPLFLNGNNYVSTDSSLVAEFIHFNTSLTRSQRQQVEGYLAWKWGLEKVAVIEQVPAVIPTEATGCVLWLDGSDQTTILNGAKSATSLSPITIPGCALWLDATDSATIKLSGSNMTEWRDKSGKGNNMTQVFGYSNVTVSASYQNNLNVLNFSAGGIYRSPLATGTYPIDLYVVLAVKDLTTAVDVISVTDTVSDSFNSLTFSEYTSGRWHNGSDYFNRTPNCVSSNAENTTSFILMQWSIANGNYLLRRNGTQLIQTSTYSYSLPATTNLFQLGLRYGYYDGMSLPGNPFRGYIGEIVAFNHQLATDQRIQVEGYLAQKWGLQTSLPLSHPSYSVNLNTVTTWLDKSGNNNSATASGPVTLGTRGIHFDGSALMNIPGLQNTIANTPFVFFIVETFERGFDGSGGGYVFRDTTYSGYDGQVHFLYRSGPNEFGMAFYADDLEYYGVSGYGTMRLWTLYLPAASNRNLRLNGALVATHTNYTRLTALVTPAIGQAYAGTISEFIVYNVDLGLPAIQEIENNLLKKWKLVPQTQTVSRFSSSITSKTFTENFSNSNVSLGAWGYFPTTSTLSQPGWTNTRLAGITYGATTWNNGVSASNAVPLSLGYNAYIQSYDGVASSLSHSVTVAANVPSTLSFWYTSRGNATSLALTVTYGSLTLVTINFTTYPPWTFSTTTFTPTLANQTLTFTALGIAGEDSSVDIAYVQFKPLITETKTYLPVTSPLSQKPILWLDGADTSSFTMSGSNVLTWLDKSGSNNTATTGGGSSAITRTTGVTSVSKGVVTATGGTITTNGSYTVHSFTSVGSSTFKIIGPNTVAIKYLVVGGGGGGGVGRGGGGGGGGVLSGGTTLSAGSYTITVGDGGAGVQNDQNGGDGGTSSIGSVVIATGGGGGGGWMRNIGRAGGSGGGASAGSAVSGGSGTAGQGFAGSARIANETGGGGGGAGAAALNENGAIGISSTITGPVTYYAGGGGAGANVYGTPGVAYGGTYEVANGKYGGGNGANTSGTHHSYQDGVANSGGGGGGQEGYTGLSGYGGSGIVIISYVTALVEGVFTQRGLSFDGSGYMSIPGIAGTLVNTPFAVFIVETLAGNGYSSYFFADNGFGSYPAGGNLVLGYRNPTDLSFMFYYNDLEDYSVSGFGNTRVWCFYLPTASNRVTRRNGVLDVTHSNYTRLTRFAEPTLGRFYSGANYTGVISEVIVYASDPGLPAIQSIEQYLLNKWMHTSLPDVPGNIPGMALWLDGADVLGNGVLTSDGSLVTTWFDKSGNNANATLFNGSVTYNGKSQSLSFNGASYLKLPDGTLTPGGSTYTIFVVCRPLSLEGYPYVYFAGNASNDTCTGLVLYPDGRVENGFYADYMGFAASETVSANESYLFTSAFNGASRTLYLNGTPIVTGSPSGTKNVANSNNYIGGDGGITSPVTNVSASGGTITTVGNRKFHTFTSNGTFTLSSNPGNAVIEVFAIGGGGGAGIDHGGGGGAGGLVILREVFPAGVSYNVVVGSGGATGNPGANGTPSTFGSNVYALGGGGGGCYNSGSGINGVDGGCGGGTNKSGDNHTGGVGSQGGSGGTPTYGGGGMGTGGGGVGGSASGGENPYKSGIGVTYYGSNYGGGGCGYQDSSLSEGYAYGGGRGGIYPNGGQTAGTNGTGGGGGGYYYPGSEGGSGIVIVSYGTASLFTGTISEMLVFNRTLLDTERQSVDSYLTSKWNLSHGLQSSRPVSSVPGCYMWLDGADPDGTGVPPAEWSAMKKWADKSGNGRNAVATGNPPTYAANAFNGLSAPVFNSSPMITPEAMLSQNNKLTLFMVLQPNTNNPGNYTDFFYDTSSGGGLFDFYLSPSSCVFYLNFNYTSHNLIPAAAALGKNLLVSVVSDATTLNVFANGTLVHTSSIGSNNLNVATNWNIGLGDYKGPLCEILMYASALNATQRKSIEAYLSLKWGMTNLAFTPLLTAPTLFSGCQLWLDASDFKVANGSTISTWVDKSKNSNNASATGTPVFNSKGLNSLPSVSFNGSCSLRGNIDVSGTVLTCFVVASRVASAHDQRFISISATGELDWNSVTRTTGINNQGGTTVLSTYRNSMLIGQSYQPFASPFLACSVYDGVSGHLFVNGYFGNYQASNVSTGTFAASTYCVGNQVTDSGEVITDGGFVSEVIVFNRALTDAKRQSVERYLAKKWAISDTIYGDIPGQMQGCQLWLDAADYNTLTFSGTSVTQWKDKSGMGNDGSVYGTVLYNPGSYGLIFTGSQNFVLPSNAFPIGDTPFTYFFVFSSTTFNASKGIFGGGTFNTAQCISLRNGDSATGTMQAYWCSADIQTSNTYTLNVNQIVCLTYSGNGGVESIFINGKLGVSQSPGTRAQTNGGNYIGRDSAGQFWEGQIMEALCFSSCFSTSQRETIEAYLAKKWRVTTVAQVLPTSHPFLALKPQTRAIVPIDISNCQLWLDASDTSSILNSSTPVVSNNQTLTTWNDKSGNSRNLGVVDGTVNYSNHSVVCTGSGYLQTLSAVNLSNYTVFFVATPLNYGDQCAFLAIPSAGGEAYDKTDSFAWFLDYGYQSRFYAGGGTAFPTYSWNSHPQTPGPKLFTYQTDGALSVSSWVNGIKLLGKKITFPALRTSTALGFAIGISWGSLGYRQLRSPLHEIIVYNTNLTTNERQRIEGYLAQKWKISLSAPKTFTYTGAIQSWVCPQNLTSVTVQVWGAGGGPAQNNAASGGAGAFLTGTMAVTPGTTYYIVVGGGGYKTNPPPYYVTPTVFGGGGNGYYAGGGGGYSGIFSNFVPSQFSAFIVAGGGGGAGPDGGSDFGGSGSWTPNGQNGGTNGGGTGGAGANGSGGGAGGGGTGGGGGTNGGALYGGNGAHYGGGGGGGYWGGGGGGSYVTGGGGGNSYWNTSYLTSVSGSDSTASSGTTLLYGPATGNSNYQFNVGSSFGDGSWGNGGHGLVVIVEDTATHPYASVPALSILPFSPADITGCTVWIDASQSTPLNGNWKNLANGSSYSVQCTGTLKPKGRHGLNTVILTAAQSLLVSPTIVLSNYTMFWVGRQTGGTNGRVLSSEVYNALYGYWAGYKRQLHCSYWLSQPTGYASDTAWDMFSHSRFQNGPFTFNWNGDVQVAGANSANYPLYGLAINAGDAGGEKSDCEIAEFILYTGKLTSLQIQQVEGYLAQKWGFKITTSHPYASIPPAKYAERVYTPGLYVRFYNSLGTPEAAPEGNNWGSLIGTPGPYTQISFHDQYYSAVYTLPQLDNIIMYAKGYYYSPIADTLKIYTGSDDGVQVFVNGVLAIDNWTYHGATGNESAYISVQEGYTPFYIMFFEGGGGALFEMQWKTGSTNYTGDLTGRFFCDLLEEI